MAVKPLHAGVALIAMAAVLAPGSTAPAQEAERPSVNLYGQPGLIDMPSAEAQPDGQITASYSQFGDTSRRNFTFQLLPRISGTLRYSKSTTGASQTIRATISSTAALTCSFNC